MIDTNTRVIEFYKKIGFEMCDKTVLDIPYFKEELKGMWRMKNESYAIIKLANACDH